jgi:release factor glutamine methyltransferase
MTCPEKRCQLNLRFADDAALKRVLAIASNPVSPVYPPSDDSFLMIDAIGRFPLAGRKVLDVGTGSGILGLYCAMHGAEVTASDFDEATVEQVRAAAEALGVKIAVRLSDLFSSIPDRFDLVLFNPPYLPSVGIDDRSVDGGPGGTTLVDRFLNQLPNHLGRRAEALLLLSSINDPVSVQLRHGKLNFSTVVSKPLFFEELQVLRVRLGDDFMI